MRSEFVNTLVELAEFDKRILLLTGDLGFRAVEPFSDRFADRFINVGVAEQNMVGMATGLAEAGFVPFVYSIATFASLRPYEFIRNGPVLHHSKVRIVGVGGGFEYGSAGITHHGLEDVGVMRVQPGLAVIVPADSQQTAAALRASWDRPGPIYYRIGKDNDMIVPGLNGRFELGKAEVVREGSDLLLIAMGSLASEAVDAAAELSVDGIDCTVAVVASLNPPPTADLQALISEFSIVVTAEGHYVTSGVGSLVCETVAEHGLSCRVVRVGVRNPSNGVTGSRDYLRRIHGLNCSSLAHIMRREAQQGVKSPGIPCTTHGLRVSNIA